VIKEVDEAMENLMFRTAIQKGFFDLQRNLKWYLRRCGTPNKEVISWFIEVQTKILAPFAPHISEEIWEKLGKKEFISVSEWPEYREIEDEGILRGEEYIKGVINDIREIIKVTKIKGKIVYVYTAPDWAWRVCEIVEKKRNFNDSIKEVMKDEEMRKRGKTVSKLINQLIKNRIFSEKIDEEDILKESKNFIEKEIGMKLEINKDYDPKNKKSLAIPTKPAIYIE